MKFRYVCALLAAITLAAYWNSFHAPFVFDDLATIQRNTNIRFGDLRIFTIFGTRSILYLTFLFNFWLSGQEVFSYHVVNFVIHVVNGVLLYLIGDRLLKKRPYAFAAAALFLLHPLQTESVTYISSRSELLSTSFYLAGFLIYIVWPWERGVFCAVVLAIPFVLGVGSKETAITLPATLFLYDWLFRKSIPWRFYLMYAVGACTAGYLILFQIRNAVNQAQISAHDYLLTQFHVLWTYIRLVFLPFGQNLDYDYPYARSVLEPGTLLCLLGLVSLLTMGWIGRSRYTVFAFSIFWFFLTLVPTSSIVPLNDVIFEHRMYLPLAGMALSFPLVLHELFG